MYYNEFTDRLKLQDLQELETDTLVEFRLRVRLKNGRLSKKGQLVAARVKSPQGSSTLHLQTETLDTYDLKIPLLAFYDNGLGRFGKHRIEIRLL